MASQTTRTTIATLFAVGQLLLGRAEAQTPQTGKTPPGASINTPPSATIPANSSLYLNYQVPENQTGMHHISLSDNDMILEGDIVAVKGNPLYDSACFVHMGLTERGKLLRHEWNGASYYLIPGANFLNPSPVQKVTDTFYLNFKTDKTDYASVLNQNDYPKILNAIENNIKNGVSVYFTGGASRTHDVHSSQAQAQADSLHNVQLAENRASHIAAKVRADLLTRGYSPQTLDQLLKTDVQSFGDQRLVVNKSGPLVENQYVKVDLTGQKDRKYPYHILIVDPQTAAQSCELYARSIAQKNKGNGFQVDCYDGPRNLELGNEIRLKDIAHYKVPFLLDVQTSDISKLTFAIDGQKGLPDGTFTQIWTAEGMDLAFNKKVIMSVRLLDAKGNTKNPDFNANMRFVISDTDGKFVPVRFEQPLSRYIPDVVEPKPQTPQPKTPAPSPASSKPV